MGATFSAFFKKKPLASMRTCSNLSFRCTDSAVGTRGGSAQGGGCACSPRSRMANEIDHEPGRTVQLEGQIERLAKSADCPLNLVAVLTDQPVLRKRGISRSPHDLQRRGGAFVDAPLVSAPAIFENHPQSPGTLHLAFSEVRFRQRRDRVAGNEVNKVEYDPIKHRIVPGMSDIGEQHGFGNGALLGDALSWGLGQLQQQLMQFADNLLRVS